MLNSGKLKAIKACQTLAHIPLRGEVDSLNVGVAAGVMLYEIRRHNARAESK